LALVTGRKLLLRSKLPTKGFGGCLDGRHQQSADTEEKGEVGRNFHGGSESSKYLIWSRVSNLEQLLVPRKFMNALCESEARSWEHFFNLACYGTARQKVFSLKILHDAPCCFDALSNLRDLLPKNCCTQSNSFASGIN
jgi:hypothetical protein